MRKIPLTNRYGVVLDHALVDDEDFERLSKHAWRLYDAKTTRYAVRGIRPNGKYLKLMMHREVLLMEPSRLPEVDHRDTNGLNNQKGNLRAGSHSQNQWNRKAYRCNPTGLKGVTVSRGRFVARVRVNRKLHYIGSYATAGEAHEAYVATAKNLHGEFFHA